MSITCRHINGPRHSITGTESAPTTQQIQVQPTHAQQVVIAQQPQQHQQQQQQATVIHPQQMVQVHQQQVLPPQAHQVHQVPVSGQQHGHRTYTVFNDGHGMEYTDIQAVSIHLLSVFFTLATINLCVCFIICCLFEFKIMEQLNLCKL